MKKTYIFLADGFETVEALAPVDVMRRAGLQVVTVSIMKRNEVMSAQDIYVTADTLFEECNFSDADAFILPGGSMGTENLSACEPLRKEIERMNNEQKLICAICAAPMILGRMGILAGRRATCYPGCESELTDAEYTAASVQEDKNIITACGPGASFDFGFAIVNRLCNESTVTKLRSQMQFN